MRRVQDAAGDVARVQLFLEVGDRAGRAGDHAERRAVDRRQRKLVAEERGDLILWQRHAEHVAGREGLHHRAARGDQLQRVLQRQHRGEARGDILADAVADHAGWLHAP